VVAQEFLPHPPRKDLLIYGNRCRPDHASARTRPPLFPPELRAAHRVWCTGLSPRPSTSPTL
jgi:hypothetical protein